VPLNLPALPMGLRISNAESIWSNSSVDLISDFSHISQRAVVQSATEGLMTLATEDCLRRLCHQRFSPIANRLDEVGSAAKIKICNA
jgi:hypothetical protein